jgi:hypothetical protein
MYHAVRPEQASFKFLDPSGGYINVMCAPSTKGAKNLGLFLAPKAADTKTYPKKCLLRTRRPPPSTRQAGLKKKPVAEFFPYRDGTSDQGVPI